MCVMKIFGDKDKPSAQAAKDARPRAGVKANERTGQNLTGAQRGGSGGGTLLSTAFSPASEGKTTLLGG